MKKWIMKISLLALLIVVVLITNIEAKAENSVADFKYKVSSGQVTITDYIGTTKNVVIPAKINGISVEIIEAEAFAKKELLSVQIPDSVMEIHTSAFANNKLTSVKLPKNLYFLELYAFGDNQLTSIKIPENVMILDASVFANNNLTKIELPMNLRTIDSSTFENNKLTNVVIPSSVTSIKSSAFANNRIKTLNLPDKMLKEGDTISIGSSAFENNELTDLTIPSTIEKIGPSAFKNNQLKTLTLSKIIEEIPTAAFENNQLTSLNVPTNIKKIEASAFKNNELTNVMVLAKDIVIQDDAFGENELKSLIVPDGTEYSGSNKLYRYKLVNNEMQIRGYRGTETEVIIPNKMVGYTVTSIGESAFKQKKISSITIPDTITVIGPSSFKNNELVNITLSDNVKSIGSNAFESNWLTKIKIPDSVGFIGANAFKNNYLANVTIPDSVSYIGDNAFENNYLVNVTIPNTITSIGVQVFNGNPLKTLHLPKDLEYKGLYESFYYSLKDEQLKITGSLHIGGEIVIPNKIVDYTVTIIGWNAFSNKKLTSVTVPDMVTIIEGAAFSNNLLTHINLPEGIKRIEHTVFANNNLTKIIIPDKVDFIGSEAFTNNNLTNIKLPESVKEVSFKSFANNELKTVTLPKNIEKIESNAFIGNDKDELVISTYKNSPSTTMLLANNYKLNYIKPILLLNILTSSISDTTTLISGQTEPHATLLLLKDNNIIAAANADTNGNYSIHMAKQKAGTILSVVAMDAEGNKTSLEKIVLDQTPPELIVNEIADNVAFISGKTEAKALVTVRIGDTVLQSTIANQSGFFTIKMAKQKAGTKISVVTKDYAENSKTVVKKVVDKTAPFLTVKDIEENEKLIRGKTEAGTMVIASIGRKVIGAVTANKNGTFTIRIPKVKTGVKVTVSSKDKSSNVKSITKIIIDKTSPKAPKVSKVTTKSSTVTGVAEAGSTVYVYKGKTKLGSAKVTSKGSFKVKIKKQKLKTKLTVYAVDQAKNMSKKVSVTVAK